MTVAADVILIGAGITGLVTAHAPARDGVTAHVVDACGPVATGSGWTLAGARFTADLTPRTGLELHG